MLTSVGTYIYFCYTDFESEVPWPEIFKTKTAVNDLTFDFLSNLMIQLAELENRFLRIFLH